MDSLLQDLRLAARQLIRQEAFAAVVVATLALAISANTLTFSFVNFFVFRPLPMKEVPRLVVIYAKHPEHGRDRARVSYADFLEWREQSTSFEDLAAGGLRTHSLTGAGEPMRVQGFAATASLFTEWGLGAAAGRVIQRDDDRKGAPRVAVLSHGFWTRQFGANPGIVGTSLRLDGRPHVVVGVLTPSIEIGTLSEIDVWTPLMPEADPADRTHRDLLVSGRLKHGVDLSRAAAEIQSIALRQQREHPDTNAGWSAYVLPIRSGMTGANSWVILALMAVAVSLVLAIACANVANLMLARGTARQRETALRTALGGSRVRIVRLLLTEALVLSLLGGALGLLLAGAGLDYIRSLTFEPFFALVVVDRRVTAFSVAISLVAPVLFGLVPALQATRVDLVSALKEGGGSVGGSRRRVRGRNMLVSGQLALAMALLLVAGLVVRTALAMQALPLGFDHHRLLTMKTELPEARYPDDAGRGADTRVRRERRQRGRSPGAGTRSGRVAHRALPSVHRAPQGRGGRRRASASPLRRPRLDLRAKRAPRGRAVPICRSVRGRNRRARRRRTVAAPVRGHDRGWARVPQLPPAAAPAPEPRHRGAAARSCAEGPAPAAGGRLPELPDAVEPAGAGARAGTVGDPRAGGEPVVRGFPPRVARTARTPGGADAGPPRRAGGASRGRRPGVDPVGRDARLRGLRAADDLPWLSSTRMTASASSSATTGGSTASSVPAASTSRR
jgi:MacB-like periplasmic core domain